MSCMDSEGANSDVGIKVTNISDSDGYLSNPDMENFVDQEFMRAIGENEAKERAIEIPPETRRESDNHSYPQIDSTSTPAVNVSGQNSCPSPGTTGMPEVLVQAGWRMFWSQRENRYYFFNKLTNQSLWDMPQIAQAGMAVPKSPTGAAPLNDPLGLSSATTTKTASPDNKSQPVSLKRRSIDETWNGVSRNKQPKLECYWNFDINTDVMVMESAPCNLAPPIPEVEQFRATLTNQLRQHYQDMCHSREGIDAPNESFNRWILERKVSDRGRDPMLPTDCPVEVSPSMYREIMHDIPIRLSRIKYLSDARKQLFCYAEAAKKMIETRNTTAESRKQVKWQTEETFSWLRKEQNALLEDYLDRLSHLRRQCGPHLAQTAKNSVEAICIKMYHMARECSKKIFDKATSLLQLNKIEIPVQPNPTARLVPAAPTKMITPTPPLTGVTQERDKTHVSLTYKSEVMRINGKFMEKLELLYRHSCHDDPTMSNFLPRVWCLLRRYQTMFGPNQYEGIVLQGALPVPVFKCLHDIFGVTMECFASPLNCYFKHYCSAFTDTDSYFGSSGPVLQFFPVSGSFEANAPFAEELMESMVDHFDKLLAQTDKPLSFIVFVPEWRDPTPVATLHMENSRFKRKQVLIPAFEHEYRSGLQHVAPVNEVYHKSVHGTLLFFLQNDAGFEKWGPTPARLRELLSSFQPEYRTCSENLLL
ncbi:mRNA (2'-O-methyladenosine-N(6)-)-methyltransferase-like isoform X1 [Styela clava]